MLASILPYIALCCIPLMSSINAVVSRAAFTMVRPGEIAITPFALTALRQFLALATFVVARHVRDRFLNDHEKKTSSEEQVTKQRETQREQQPQPSLNDFLGAWILGISTFVNIFMFLLGVQLTDGVTTAAALATIPAQTFCFGLLFKMERFLWSRAIGAVLVTIGNLMMVHLWRIFTGDVADSGRHSITYYVGVALLVAAASLAALYLLFQRPISARLNFVDCLLHVYAASCVCVFIVACTYRDNVVTAQLLSGKLSLLSWAAAVFGGVFQSGLGFFLVAYVSNAIGSSVTLSIFRAAAPVLVVIESVVFLDEDLDKWQLFGGLVVVAAIVVSLIPTTEQQAQHKQVDASVQVEKPGADVAAVVAVRVSADGEKA